jgi:hypothetical protein
VKDSSWVERSCFRVSIFVSMVECIFLLMVVILALSFRTSFWASEKSNDKVLRWASRSWLWVWAMMKGGTRKGWVGPHRKGVMGEGYHDD